MWNLTIRKGSNKEKDREGTWISKGRKNCEIEQFCKIVLITFLFTYPVSKPLFTTQLKSNAGKGKLYKTVIQESYCVCLKFIDSWWCVLPDIWTCFNVLCVLSCLIGVPTRQGLFKRKGKKNWKGQGKRQWKGNVCKGKQEEVHREKDTERKRKGNNDRGRQQESERKRKREYGSRKRNGQGTGISKGRKNYENT